MSNLSDHDIQRIVAGVTRQLKAQRPDDTTILVQKVVQEMTTKGLAFVGVDAADKAQLAEFKEDLRFTRHLRQQYERIGQSVSNAIANTVVFALLGLLGLGIWFWFRGGASPPLGPPSMLSK